MEKSLDATATTTSTSTSVTPSPFVASPFESQTSQTTQPLLPSQSLMPGPSSVLASASPEDILDRAIRFISADDAFLTEDELLAASLFFTSTSEDAIRAARTFC
jgi:hypothetical protein